MRLRIKQQDDPCTSNTITKSQQHLPPNDSSPQSSPHSSPKRSPSSPNSPIGRVAKRNARILSGLDLGLSKTMQNGRTMRSTAGYSDNLVGTIPDFTIRRLQDVCPALTQALKSESVGQTVDDGVLTDLQFQLENLLAENMDGQKNIFGEVVFLTTGDYPSDDLTSRLMPSFELRDDHFGSRYTDLDDPQPSISYIDQYRQDDDDVGSDAISSMDEREQDEPYCVLDIPHRFWTWVHEYIGHVDEKFLRDFDQNFYQRYQPEKLESYFVNEPFKYKMMSLKNQKESPSKHLNGIHKTDQHQQGRKTSKTQLQSSLNDDNDDSSSFSPSPKKRNSVQVAREQLLKSLNPDDNASDLMKRLVTAYIEEQSHIVNDKKRGRRPVTKTLITSPTKSSTTKRQKSKKSTIKMNGDLNNKLNGHMNGVESTDDEMHQDLLSNSELMESIGQALAECVMPVGAATSNGVVSQEIESGSDESDLEERDVVGKDNTVLSNNLENFELVKLSMDSKHTIDELDEVSAELLKAQQRLEQLVKKTLPVLGKCKEDLEAEHANWVTTRALNSIDDELFRLANKIPASATQPPEELFKHCLDVWEQRKRFLFNHYIRDHIKFVQYTEKSNKDAREMEAILGVSTTPETPVKRVFTGETSGAKTRSNRKKPGVSRELYAEAMVE